MEKNKNTVSEKTTETYLRNDTGISLKPVEYGKKWKYYTDSIDLSYTYVLEYTEKNVSTRFIKPTLKLWIERENIDIKEIILDISVHPPNKFYKGLDMDCKEDKHLLKSIQNLKDSLLQFYNFMS